MNNFQHGIFFWKSVNKIPLKYRISWIVFCCHSFICWSISWTNLTKCIHFITKINKGMNNFEDNCRSCKCQEIQDRLLREGVWSREMCKQPQMCKHFALKCANNHICTNTAPSNEQMCKNTSTTNVQAWLWKSFIRMVVMIARKFLYHIEKRNYLWKFRCLEFRHLPRTLISRLKKATNFPIARSCRFGDHCVINVRQLVCAPAPSLFMLLGVRLIQMASPILLAVSWLSLAARRVPSQSITWFSLPAWSVIADLLLVCLDSCFCERVKFCCFIFSQSFLFSSILVPSRLLVSPM